MTHETKHFAIQDLQVKEENGTRTVEGFASVFNNVDSYKDIVLPGAFAKSLKSRKPAMLWQHRSDDVIGLWDDMEERDKGLYVKGRILDTSMGDDAYKLVKAGAVTGMSIGYSPKNYEIDEKKGVRKLLELELYEVSLVTFPANEKAQITRVKNAHGNERDFEEFLREAGYSRDAAKIITAKGFKALSGQREAEGDVLKEINSLFNQIKA